MVKSVYVPQAGGIVSFPDEATPQQMLSYIRGQYGTAIAAPAPPPPGPDQSGILGAFAYDFATGLTNIPGGIASLMYPAEEAGQTAGGRFSEGARQVLQEKLGVDPTKERTTGQTLAGALGSVGSFLLPGTAALKGATLLGRTAGTAGRVATGTAATQGVALGAEQRSERIRQQLESGMNIPEETQLAAQRLSGLIGASEALPINRFFAPLNTLLSKIPASKAPIVERIIQSRLGKITRAGVAEGAQEAASGIANDLMEYGVYNPDVQIGEDLLSNAGTGAFAGSFVEGVIQLAAGRKLAPYRQLQEDISREGVANYEAARQGRMTQAAEDLRQYNVNGPVDIVEQELDGLTSFSIKSPGGNAIGRFDSREEAEGVLDRYAQLTGAKVSVREMAEMPKAFPIKIGKKKYNSFDEIRAARDNAIAQRESVSKLVTDPDILRAEAERQKTDPDLYRNVAFKEVQKQDEAIRKLEAYLPELRRTVDAVEEIAVPPAVEPPIGAVEMPIEEPRYIEEVETEPAVTPEQPTPEGRVEMRPSATVEQLADLQAEMFGAPINVNQMTEEQRSTYEAERDRRYPPEPVTTYYSAGPAQGARPRNMREAASTVPESRPRRPEVEAKMSAVYEGLLRRLESIAPPETKLNIRTFIDEAGPDVLVKGVYTPADPKTGTKGIIDLASGIYDPSLSVEQMIDQMVSELNHEVIHALRNNGLIRASEWRMLSRAAVNTKVPGRKYTYLDKAQAIYTPEMSPDYANPDAVVEEAVAEMYRDWVNRRNNKDARQVGGLFNRITEFFRSIFRSLKSSKYEQVFEAIEAGEVRGREGAPIEADVRFSVAPALNTEAFQRWFGDSKVVDESGKPLVVYHGTNAVFAAFDPTKSLAEGGAGTFFFAASPRAASSYAAKPGGNVAPVFLSLKNPLIVGFTESFPADGTKIEQDAWASRVEAFNRRLDRNKEAYFEAQIAAAKRGGRDGVIFREVEDNALAVGFVVPTDIYVAFEPTQIKSVFNRGTFDPTDPRILYSAAPALSSEEFKRWFRNSKVVDAEGKPLVVYHGTSDVFDEFKQDTGGKKDRGWLGRGFYFTNNTGVANAYAMIKPGVSENVIPVYISIQNPYYATLEEKAQLKEAEQSGDTFAAQEFTDKLRAAGYDGVVLDYKSEDGAKEYVIFDPVQVKSVFNQFEEGAATSPRFSAAPLPPYVEQRNRTLFRPEPKVPFYQSMFDLFLGHPTVGKTIRTVYGDVDLSRATRFAVSARAAGVDKNAYIELLEKVANEKRSPGNFQRMEADYSAVAALAWSRRSSQLAASVIMMGKPSIKYARPGDIQSATIAAEEDPNSLLSIFKVMMEPGPVDSVTGEQKDKREVFKSYATAMRAIGLKAQGKPVPRELDDTYINTTIQFTRASYPDIVEAYEKYQRFNKNLLTAARDAGVITPAELANLTRKMDYYGFYREVFEEELVPGLTSKTAAKFDLRAYKGSQYGNLIDDPMYVIVQNTQFWMSAIARNIATTKAFNLARDMGEARLLGASEKPDPARGESDNVMFYRVNGVQKRFAVSDPLLVTALGSDETVDVGGAMKFLSMPTKIVRESVTRDPAFMLVNLVRDTLSSWVTSGEDITPFLGTAKGFAQALKGSASFNALMGRGVVGSYDLAMRDPSELAAILRRRLNPPNVMSLGSVEGATSIVGMLWDRLGVLSEASDAATRIAVYEAAKKQGFSEAEATFRAIQILDFSRRGSSQMLNVLIKLIPFLNARIQGLDVLYQAGRAGLRVLGGKAQGEVDANLGKKFLVRGALLAAISVALEAMNEDDEDYQDLPDYLKTGNLLIPLDWAGLEGQYFAIAKPFEAGLLFSTIPQQFYKSMQGDVSTRENVNMFFWAFGSTFGVNPIPQIALPALEIIVNHDFYTGLPLISEGKARLSPELQYDSRTSTLAMMLGDVPIKYNFTTGKFEGVSPIVIDQLIGGYGGPFGTLIAQSVGMAMEGFNVGPDRLPRDITQLPVVRRFLMDAESRNPKTVSQAYELFRIVDEANRSFSRIRQTGDAEAVMDYLEENRDTLSYKKYVYKLVDRLNKISAYERQIERDQTMTREEKVEALKRLREVRARLTSNIGDINKALGR